MSGDTSINLLLWQNLSTSALWTNSVSVTLCTSLCIADDPSSLIQLHHHPKSCSPAKSRHQTQIQSWRDTSASSLPSICLYLFGYHCYCVCPLFHFLLLILVYNSTLILAEVQGDTFLTLILNPLLIRQMNHLCRRRWPHPGYQLTPSSVYGYMSFVYHLTDIGRGLSD